MKNIDRKLMQILKMIKEKRSEYGYSQEFMASALGIGQSAYSKLEQGKIPMNMPTFIKILYKLNVDFEKLLDKKFKEMSPLRKVI